MKPADLLFAPVPKRVSLLGGFFTLPAQGFVVLAGQPTDQLLLTANKLATKLGPGWQLSANPAATSTRKSIVLACSPTAARGPEGYSLDVRKAGVTISAAEPAGVFYGVCTLLQLLDANSTRIPCLSIVDWPDFPARGVMIATNRDRVPTMETTKALVDLLSQWKINRFELYMEHTFAYIGHEVVWNNASPFTGEEILELDAYCRERFVELVPTQNSFGHMWRWLKHRPYASLAETTEGLTLTAGGKASGPDCLSPVDPGSIALVEDIFGQLLPHFTSRNFNACCDETWSLGKGRSRELCEKVGVGRVYLDFVLQIHKLVTSHGRRMHFWGDIIHKHPELIPEIPKDIVALEWGYEDWHDFLSRGARFAESGLEFHVCPGTSSWNSITGRTENAVHNLRNAAVQGLATGATGYLNTDWGDNGHLQYLPVSYLGFLYGACASWNADKPGNLRLPEALSAFAFRDRTGTMGQAVYDFGNAYLEIEKRVGGATPWGRVAAGVSTPFEMFEGVPVEQIDRANGVLRAALAKMRQSQMDRPDAKLIADEFANAAAMVEAVCKMGKMECGMQTAAQEKLAVANLLQECIREHDRLWLSRNRPGGLPDSRARLERLLALNLS